MATIPEPHSSVLLHTCCADCAVKAIHSLRHKVDNFEELPPKILLYFDNSNIHPRAEWLARLDAVKRVIAEHDIEVIVEDWSPRRWYEAIEGNTENIDQRRRCKSCWYMRLESTANKARSIGTAKFSTTLLTSTYQNRKEIEKIGKSLSDTDLEFVTYEVKKDASGADGVYLQNYCGCVYSLANRYEEKWGEE